MFLVSFLGHPFIASLRAGHATPRPVHDAPRTCGRRGGARTSSARGGAWAARRTPGPPQHIQLTTRVCGAYHVRSSPVRPLSRPLRAPCTMPPQTCARLPELGTVRDRPLRSTPPAPHLTRALRTLLLSRGLDGTRYHIRRCRSLVDVLPRCATSPRKPRGLTRSLAASPPRRHSARRGREPSRRRVRRG